MKYFSAIILVSLMATSCATVQVDSDVEEGFSLNNYNSYSVRADLNSGLEKEDELFLLGLLEDAMAESGLQQADNGVLIWDVSAAVLSKERVSSIGMPLSTPSQGGSAFVSENVGWGTDHYGVVRYALRDRANNQIRWQIQSSERLKSDFSSEDVQGLLERSFEKVLNAMP